MYIGVYVKYLLLVSDFSETWMFSIDFQKNTQISNFMKIRPVGAELFHAGRRTKERTDMTKFIVAIAFSRVLLRILSTDQEMIPISNAVDAHA